MENKKRKLENRQQNTEQNVENPVPGVPSLS